MEYKISIRAALIGGAALYLVLPMPANAQFLTRTEPVVSVSERADPNFDAIGGQLGAFKIDTGISVEQRFDDNIFRTTSETESDSITVLTPAVTISPDLPIHDISLTAGARIGKYWSNTEENYQDLGAQLSGRYDFDYNTNVRFLTGYAARHEDRSSPEASGGDTPVEFTVLRNEIGAARELGTLKVSVVAQDQRLEFDDNSVDGAPIDNSARDRSVQTISARVGYALSPATEVFTTPTYTWTNYERSDEDDRSSQGYDITVGASHDISGKLHTDLYLGYFARDMDNDRFKNIGGAKFGGSLLWNPTALTSVKGELGRQIREVSQSEAAGYIQTNASLGVEHALTRRTTLDASVGWANFDFEGERTGIDRQDDVKQTKLGAQYRLFNGAALNADYTFTTRTSNEVNSDYENAQFNVGVGYAY